MKFGKYLEKQKVSEWNEKYVNYKMLRKSIKRFKVEIDKLNLDLHDKRPSLISHEGLLLSPQPMSRISPSISLRNSISTLSLRNLVSLGNNNNVAAGNNSPTGEYSELNGADANIHNSSNIDDGNNSNDNGINIEHQDFFSSMNALNEIQEKILDLFTDEVSKVNEFFSEREREAIDRFNKIKEQVPLYVQSKQKKKSEKQKLKNNTPQQISPILHSEIGHVIIDHGTSSPINMTTIHEVHEGLLQSSNENINDENNIENFEPSNGDAYTHFASEEEPINSDDDHPLHIDEADLHNKNNNNNQNIIEMKIIDETKRKLITKLAGIKDELINPLEIKAKQLISIGKKSNEDILKEAMREFYHYLILLKNFQVINYTAFVKILKKAEKNTNLSLATKILGEIDKLPLKTSKKVEKITKSLENLYTDLFSTSRSIRDARKQLRNSDRSSSNPTTSSFFTGVCTGWTTAILILIYYFIWNNDAGDFVRFSQVYNLYSTLGLVLLWTFMFGVDCYIWTKFHVHYSFIFEISHNKLNYIKIFQAVTVLSVLWITSIGIYAWTSVGSFPFPTMISPEFYPLILMIIYLCILFCPFNIFQLATRKWFLNTIFRVVTAPAKSVRFKDFFMGDQMSSLVLMMNQLSLFICFYSVDAWRPASNAVCSAKGRYFQPFISAAPAYFRFVQCLRRYYDSRDPVHLRNALKYFLSIVVVFFSTMDSFFSHDGWRSPFRIIWLLFGAANSLYSYYWDIFMDWSILTPTKPSSSIDSTPPKQSSWDRLKPWKYQVRKKRMYPNILVYYLAIISNLGFRFTWTMSKSLPQLIKFLPSYKLVVVIGIVEIVRRGQWNIYRLENEHLNNCGKFRVTREIPLPFDVHK